MKIKLEYEFESVDELMAFLTEMHNIKANKGDKKYNTIDEALKEMHPEAVISALDDQGEEK